MAANAESREAARSGAGVVEVMNSPEAISGDISMGPTPDATVATPSAAGAASAEGTTPYGAYPLSAELVQVLEEGLTPEETQAACEEVPRQEHHRRAAGVGPRRTAHRHRGRRGVQEDDHGERTRTCSHGSSKGEGRRAGPHNTEDPPRAARRTSCYDSSRDDSPCAARRRSQDPPRAATRRSWKNGRSRGAARREARPEHRCGRLGRHRNSRIDSSVADSPPTLQTHDPRADRAGTSAAASAPPNCDAEPWTPGRKHAVARRDARDAAGGETACDGRTPGRGRCSPTRTGPCAASVRWRATTWRTTPTASMWGPWTTSAAAARPSTGTARRRPRESSTSAAAEDAYDTCARPATWSPPSGGWWRWCEATASKSTLASSTRPTASHA